MLQTFGPHVVRNGNVMDSAGIAQLMGGEQADIIYSDPPWGDGNLKFWSTHLRKATGQQMTQPPLADFLNQIFTLARQYSKGIFLVEYGIKWDAQVIELGQKYGFHHLGYSTPVYGKPARPLHLHLFSKQARDVSPAYFASLNNTTGFETVRRATEPFKVPGGLVLDMCCGLGYSAKMAIHWGMRFRGNELNSERLKETIKKIELGMKRQASTVSA